MQLTVLSLLVVIVLVGSAPPPYAKKTTCKIPTCVYDYALSGEMHDKRGKEEVSLAATITLRCESVGVYNNESVTYFCMDVKDVTASLFEVKNNDETKKNRKATSNIDSLMRNKFCFIRNDNGTIVSVIHPPDEKTDVVSFKKTITSAFQANFAKTDTMTETDSQSNHTSHYSYKKKGKDTIEHRSVNNSDVTKYSGKSTDSKQIGFKSEEDIEVDDDNKIIKQSQGKSSTTLTKTVDSEEDDNTEEDDIPPIETISVYKLRLKKCLTVAKSYEYTTFGGNTPSKMDTLLAHFDERHHDVTEMEQLYNELPDLHVTAERMSRSVHSQKEEEHKVSKWKRFIQLEAKQGPLPGQQPLVYKLVNKLQEILSEKSEKYRQLRLIIYSLLSYEGSLLSQQTLMNSLSQTDDYDELNNVILAITMLQSVHSSTVSHFKQYALHNTTDDQSLLSYATLGRHKNVQQEIVRTLTEMLSATASNDSSLLIHLIHALGNTGSPLIVQHITPFVYSTNSIIQQAAIDSLRTVSTDNRVKLMFNDIVSETTSIDTLVAITESLNFPFHSFLYYPERPVVEENEIEHDLIENIFNATIDFSDSDLYKLTKLYLKNTGTQYGTALLQEIKNIEKRLKRSTTTNWGYTSNPTFYNLVASRSSQVYPYNRAYTWRKHIGPSKIHAKFAVSGFGGVGATGYKVFGKGTVHLYAYGRSYEAVRAEYLNEFHTDVRGRASVRRYIKVCGVTLLSNSNGVRLPYQITWTKNFFRMQVFHAQYRIYVWIGPLDFYVRGEINFDASLVMKMGAHDVSAKVDIGPSFTVTGGASVTLLVVYKVGLEIKGTIGYYVTPKASATLCEHADASACFGIYHGSKGVNVKVYAFYEKRSCHFRSWKWVCNWERRGKLGLLSSNFRISAIRQRLLWSQCTVCNCKGPIHGYCTGKLLVGAANCSCR